MRARVSLWALSLLAVTTPPGGAEAYEPYYTVTRGVHSYTDTQTAYTPVAVLGADTGLNNPDDLYVSADDRLYIADTGNGRVLALDTQGRQAGPALGGGIFTSPTGVFVAANRLVYVADRDAEKVFVLEPDGTVRAVLGRPTSPLFGDASPFRPLKVVADVLGNVTLSSEGSTSGLIQLTPGGEFLGYAGVNPVPVSLKMVLERIFFTEAQKGQLLRNLPPSPDNVALDQEGLLYTTTRGVRAQTIRKLNVAGKNLLPADVWFSNDYVDLTVDSNDNILAASESGIVDVYDGSGDLLFAFGGSDTSVRLGLVRRPSGIGLDSRGRLYLLDRERGTITVFEPTEFARTVNRGIGLYRQGLYEQSREPWEQTLRQNDSFALAHRAIGRALLKLERYPEALAEFAYSRDRKGWSEAFWEVRNAWLQRRLGAVVVVIVAAAAAVALLRRLGPRIPAFRAAGASLRRAGEVRFLRELAFTLRFLRHPVDSFYALRWEGATSVGAATVLFALLGVVHIASIFAAGFLFETRDLAWFSLTNELIILYAPVALWVVANYLISSITDGEGRARDVYTGTACALTPYLVFSLPLALFSRVLTLNESFLHAVGQRVILAWCGLELVIMVKEVHNYRLGQTLRNILVTAFGMVILVLVLIVLYVLSDQLWDFVYSIVQEVRVRV